MWPFSLRKKAIICRPAGLLQQLEERIVLDAAVAPTVKENINPQVDSVKDAGATPETKAIAAPDNAASGGASTAALPTQFDHIFNKDLNVVLVSNALADVKAISDAAAADAKVIVFDAQHDNLSSLSGKLQDLVASTGQKIGVLTLVGHGTQGILEIGTDQLTLSTIGEYAPTFVTLAQDLTQNTQIQFYACNLAGDYSGEAILQYISVLSGAEVFASDDATGSTRGDWTIEYATNPSVPMVKILSEPGLASAAVDLGAAELVTDRSGNLTNPTYMTVYHDKLYFSAYSGPGHGQELYVYDGTNLATLASGADVNAGGSSSPSYMTVFNDKLYFNASNGTQGKLYVYDGTNPATLAPGADVSGMDSSNPSYMTVYHGKLYFSAYNGSQGELYMYDGTNPATLASGADVNPGGSSNPSYMTVYNDKLYFSAYNGSQVELYVYDGTNSATLAPGADVNPGGGDNPRDMTVYSDKLYFSAYNGSQVELYVYDGTNPATLAPGADVNPGGSSSPRGMTVYNGLLYFNASPSQTGWELFVYDGTNPATLAPGIDVHDLSYMTVYNDKLYFSAYTQNGSQYEYELYVYDGANPATLAPGADINPGGSSSPSGMTVYNDKLYFSASNGSQGELYVYDGTNPATLAPGADVLAGDSSGPKFMTVYNEKLYFLDGELYVYDGANPPTLAPGADVDPGSSGYVLGMTVYNDKLYFSALGAIGSEGTQWELFVYDGTNPATLAPGADIDPEGSSSPSGMTVYNEKLYFSASNGSQGELYVYDGTNPATLAPGADVNPGGGDNPRDMIVYNGMLYFSADNLEHGRELWRWSATSAPSVNDAPAGTDRTVTMLEDGTYVVTAADFGFTDPLDNPANAFSSVKITQLVTAGSLKINGVDVTLDQIIPKADIDVGHFVFTPGANANGTSYANFGFAVMDDGGTANGGVDTDQSPNTFTFNVTSVNDAPAGPTAKNVQILEDNPYVVTAADFGFSDPSDNPANNFAGVKITSFSSNASLSLNGVDVILDQIISKADIDAGHLVFIPAANAHNYASFGFAVIDDGGTANGGVNIDQSPSVFLFNIQNVNDAPAGTDKVVTMPENGTYVINVADFGFSDPYDYDPTGHLTGVKITQIVTAGSLKLDGVDVTLDQVISRADIEDGLLVFAPAPNAHGTNYANFAFAVIDSGGTANGGVDTDQSPNTFTFDVATVNQAPAGTDKVVTMLEDRTYVVTAADFGFTDPLDNPANAFSSVKITQLTTAGSLKLSVVDVTLNQVIAKTDIDAGLLVFSPAANANGTGYSNFKFAVTDDGGTANGGLDTDQSPNAFTFNVTAINDAPAGTDKTVSMGVNNNYVITLADFGFTDPLDNPANAFAAVKVTQLETAGSLKLNGVDVTLNQVITKANIDAGYLTFTPAANAYGTGYASFKFAVKDNGGTANGGINFDQSPNTFTFNVAGNVNHAPAGTDKVVTMLEDGTYVVTAADFGFTDPVDNPYNNLSGVKITQLETAGSLKLNGVDVTLNQVIAKTDIDAGSLVFSPAANANGTGYSNFKFAVMDDGGTQNGGINIDQSPNTLTFNVTKVNDAPAGTDKLLNMAPNQTYVLTAADFGFTDPLDNPANAFAAVKVTQLETAGSLKLNGVDVTLNQVITKANIDAGYLTFTPAANAYGTGYASFKFAVKDNGGAANGGINFDQSPNTFTFNVVS